MTLKYYKRFIYGLVVALFKYRTSWVWLNGWCDRGLYTATFKYSNANTASYYSNVINHISVALNLGSRPYLESIIVLSTLK